MDNNTYKYRPGGVVIKNGWPAYLVLSNGRVRWSVQLANHIIFKERRQAMIREYENKIKRLTTANIKLYNDNKQLKAMIKELGIHESEKLIKHNQNESKKYKRNK